MSRNAIVTGGSRGIGKAIVEYLTKQKYKVAFSYHKSEHASRSIENDICREGGVAHAYPCDVTNYEDTARFVNTAKKALGEIDILINNAGISQDRALFAMSEIEWRAVIDTNLTGCYNVTRQIIGNFIKKKCGCIVNVASVAGFFGVPGQTNYCASKGGVIAFTKALAKEVGRFGIRVNGVAPGIIETEMASSFNQKQIDDLKKLIPFNRFGTPNEVADLVSFLISDYATYITGQIFTIDGGLTS